jgi:hypothetical protein
MNPMCYGTPCISFRGLTIMHLSAVSKSLKQAMHMLSTGTLCCKHCARALASLDVLDGRRAAGLIYFCALLETYI